MVTSAQRRVLQGLGKAPPTEEDARVERMISTLAAQLKTQLKGGYDVTIILSRHSGDGQVNVKQTSTLPPHVSLAVLQALAFTDQQTAPKAAAAPETDETDEARVRAERALLPPEE